MAARQSMLAVKNICSSNFFRNRFLQVSLDVKASKFLSNNWCAFLQPTRCLALDGSAPKARDRARPPYMLFVSDKYAELAKANPGVKPNDIARMLGQLWRLLPMEQKEVYRTQYAEEKAACDEHKKELLNRMSPAERDKMAEDAKIKKRLKLRRRKRKLMKELGKPVATDVNPFILFVKARTIERGDAPLQQYVHGLAERWKMMPEEDKEEYVKTARENSARYRQKLAEWEKRMIVQGHGDLVRFKTRRKSVKKANAAKKVTPTSRTSKKTESAAKAKKSTAQKANINTPVQPKGNSKKPTDASRKKTG